MPLTNIQFDYIQRKYDARQLHNQHVVQQRKDELYEKYPRLKELEDLIASTSVSHAKKLLNGDQKALLHLKQDLFYLRAERAAILASAGLDESYFEPPYACPDCQDTGFIDGMRCHCFEQAAIDLVYTQSNIRYILQEENFSKFSYNWYSDSPSKKDEQTGLTPRVNAEQVVSKIIGFIKNFGIRFDNLLLYGDTGTGKTFLSNCIAKELLDSGYSVIYFSAFDLFGVLEKSKFEKDIEASSIMQNIFDCDLLIIDDLGTELQNTFTLSQFFLCINERLARKRSTIISTNFHIKQLSTVYSERILSRISSNYQVLKLFGDDIRYQKNISKK